MTALALLLLTIGTADLFRHVGGRRVPAPLTATGAGVLAAVVGAWGVGLDGAEWWLVPCHLAVLASWLVVPEMRRPRARPAALVGLGVSAVATLALADHLAANSGPVERWYASLELRALDGVAVEQLVLAAACLVFLHSSANVIVRLVLADSGPQVLASEQTLKGGRILGPLERWFIFAAALAGQPGAIAAIVAAKGIVRFPEISRHDRAGNKAEYVLVGSFVSWSLAFLFVPLFQ